MSELLRSFRKIVWTRNSKCLTFDYG
jgi:hypothetical protein